MMVAAALALTATVANAQDARSWPDKPVHIVVPLTAGSATDVMARMVAKQLGEQLVHRRQQAGGGRHDRHRRGRAGQAGRLHAAGAVGVVHRDADHLSQHTI
jgi:hypothetical protein